MKKSEAFLKPPGFSRDELNEKMKVLLSNEDFGKYIQHLDKKVVKFSDLEIIMIFINYCLNGKIIE